MLLAVAIQNLPGGSPCICDFLRACRRFPVGRGDAVLAADIPVDQRWTKAAAAGRGAFDVGVYIGADA